MYTSINSGDLHNMRTFDMSNLNGLLDVCTDMSVTQNGIHLWIGQKHIYVCEYGIDFMFLERAFGFDTVIIKVNDRNGMRIIDFVIQSDDDSEIYMSVILDA